MEVILKRDMQPLGFRDDIVNVKPGFGRNFLIPQGIADLATPSAKKVHAENLKQKSVKDAKMKATAQALAETLKALTIKVGAKVGESGKIFGSVGNIQVADAVIEKGFDIDRKAIKIIGGNPKEIGTYEAEIKLHREVDVKITFEVVGE
jgi:large subunit ribosomal protein L9